MATIQIPNLPVAIALNGDEQMEAVQAGVSSRITVNQIVQYAINYIYGLSAAPVVRTIDFTVATGNVWIIMNGTATTTVTLPTEADSAGRVLSFKNIAPYALVSATANVSPLTGGIGTAILPATDGAFATLVCDGVNWIVMSASDNGENNLIWG